MRTSLPRPTIPHLRWTAAALMMAAALGLGPLGEAGAAPRADLTIGMSVEPAGLDPTASAPVAIGQVTWQNLFEGLVRIDRNGRVQPQLARRWTVSPDGLTYRFELQRGVRFHDGTLFDSAAARFSLDRARGAASTNPQKQFFAAIAAVETPDAGTLVLRLARPSGNLLYWLGWPSAVMLAPGSAETARIRPVGTGPFRFGRWLPGDRVEIEKNADYWDAGGAARLDRVTFRFIPDPQAQAAALRTHAIDAMPELGAPELFAGFRNDPAFSAVAGTTELKTVAGLNNRRKPLDDVRVRQALMRAVDRAAVIDGASAGLGAPIGSHYTPNDPGFIDLTAVQPYDPADAKRLLAEAGYPDGFALTMKVPQMPYAVRSAEVLQALLADVGVTVRIVPTEFPAKWVEEVFLGHDFDMTVVAHAEPLDIAIYARPDYYFGYANPAFSAVIAKAEAVSGEAVRLGLYGEAQKILAAEVPALYLYAQPKLGVWDARLEGFWENEPIPSNDLTEVRWSR